MSYELHLSINIGGGDAVRAATERILSAERPTEKQRHVVFKSGGGITEVMLVCNDRSTVSRIASLYLWKFGHLLSGIKDVRVTIAEYVQLIKAFYVDGSGLQAILVDIEAIR